MKYKITIEEVISKEFEVEADAIEQAVEIAKKKYDIGEWVLDPGNLEAKQMLVNNDITGEVIDWMAF